MIVPDPLLTFEDVLIEPRLGIVNSRDDVDTSVYLDGHSFGIPIWSSPMETVTELKMAQAMDNAGGLGVVHRFMTIDEQRHILASLEYPKAIAIGLSDGLERAALDADILVIDVAHAHHVLVIELIKKLRYMYGSNKTIVAGSVATRDGVRAMFEAGAHGVRVGIGSGAACSTRKMTGVGVPQFSAIIGARRIANGYGGFVISDGGIKSSGDIVKALGAGADAVMIGSLLAGCPESPNPGLYFGEASIDAKNHTQYIEGESGTVPLTDNVTMVIDRLMAGVRSGIAYAGGHDLKSFRDVVRFNQITQAGYQIESAVRVQQ